MRRQWKALISDSFVQIAVILSLLRTDLRVYLRQYSGHPEIQQALLGQSVGLHLADNYHNHNQLSYPSSKYVDDTDYIFNEINRLTRSPIYQHHTITTTWLLTNDATPQSSTSAAPLATVTTASGSSHVELSSQDVELIEQLWKDDLESTVGPGAMSFNAKEQNDVTGEYITDEESGLRVAIPESFAYEFTGDSRPLSLPGDSRPLSLPGDSRPLSLPGDSRPLSLPGGQEPRHSPQYNTQTSLEGDLLDLNPYIGESEVSQDETITNSSMIHPDQYPVPVINSWDRDGATNNTGVLWGIGDGLEFGQNSDINPITDDDVDVIEPSILDSMDLLSDDIDIDFDLDSVDTLAGLCNTAGSISGDSAVSMGSSPQYSWTDRTSSTGSERHSISSDAFDFEDGATGYSECKTEPYDNGFFDYELQSQASKYERNVVSHDHTYGAPPGGVPHVRKMDMKTTKVPSRGLAHDEEMCRKLKIPFTVETIINTPLDQFNTLIEKYKLTSKQATLIKDIRRRGKNKVAAQSCRQKRVGEFSEMEGEVDVLRSKRHALHQKRTVLLNTTTQVRKHIDIMSAEIFRTLRDENGVPYNRSQFSLEIGTNGEIEVTSTERSARRPRNPKKRDSSKRRRR